MEFILSNLSMILLVVAVISTTVSILTQFTKDIGFLNKIPTRLQVLVLAVGITVTTFIAICQYKHYIITWYSIFASVIMGIFIAYITANGWDAFAELFERFYKKKDDFK